MMITPPPPLPPSWKGRFTELNQRVQRDINDMEREFQLEKERKQLDVMRGLLRKTFVDEVCCFTLAPPDSLQY